MFSVALRSSLPLRRAGSSVWQAVAVLMPLLLLAVLGWRGILASREVALRDARQQAVRSLEGALPTLGSRWSQLLQATPAVRLYPDPPVPAPPDATQALYTEAVDLAVTDPVRAIGQLTRLAAESPDALAASGVPLPTLARWQCVRLETDPVRLLSQAGDLVADALTNHPSVLTPDLLASALARLQTYNVNPGPLADWPQPWHADERARAVWQRHEREVAARIGGWLAVPDDAGETCWIRAREEDGQLTARLLGPGALAPLRQEMTAQLLSQLPDYAAASFSLDGRPLTQPTNPAAPALLLADRQVADGLSVDIVLADPGLLYARQRQQTLWLAALLASALAASLAGFWTLRRALSRERQLGELKSNFVASVSHELRAPLASVRLLAENLESDAVPTAARRREYHGFIAEECRRLSALIDNVLDFARIEQNRRPYDFAETDAAALVADAVQLLRPRAAQRRQEITMDIQPLDPPPVCDGLAVRQALVNLLDNAVKFSPTGAVIHVRVGPCEAASWRIAVRDEGPGIPPMDHAAIFERFHRLGSELRRETQGAGIGLSIVRHLAQAHGGRVEVDSQPGAGATFTLVLPKHPPAAAVKP